MSDPGSDLMAEVVAQLNSWLGVKHVVSLVDRPQSNGVEPTNKLILRHLRALVYDERLLHAWSDPAVLAWIALTLNSMEHSETGFTPYELTFGSKDALHFKLPGAIDGAGHHHSFLKQLNANLARIREVSAEFQLKLAQERTAANPDIQTTYKPGDFVLYHHPQRVSKLQPLYRGPFEVIAQVKNDVEVRNLIRGNVMKLHVSRLKIFHGNKEEALKMAQLDNDEYEIDKFLAYKGDPLHRKRMDFLIRFCDGAELWLPWSLDLFQTVQYETFCRANPELRPLLYPAKKAQENIARLQQSVISEVHPGVIVYVDLRSYGADWYDQLTLPDKYLVKYVVEYKYLNFVESNTRIRCFCKVFNEHFVVDRDFVQRYGMVFDLPPAAVLIDTDFCSKYPEIMPRIQFITATNMIIEGKPRINFLQRA
jgi:uncharacterized ubiquitin-like protein YukD